VAHFGREAQRNRVDGDLARVERRTGVRVPPSALGGDAQVRVRSAGADVVT
jgi:hypothetical protein